jgi:hypothetical protein
MDWKAIRQKAKKWAKRAAMTGAAAVTIPVVAWTGATAVAVAYNRFFVPEDAKKLVLSTFGVDYDFASLPPEPYFKNKDEFQLWVPEEFVTFLSNTANRLPVYVRASMDGQRIKWVSSPDRDDAKRYLSAELDGAPEYQNITLLVHGTGDDAPFDAFFVKPREGHRLSDGIITVNDLMEWGIPKRDGELIQHNCGGGGGNGPSLEEVLLTDPSKGFRFNRNLPTFRDLLDNYYSVWARVFNKDYQAE